MLKKIELTNYRNHSYVQLDFFNNLNIIYGDNALGKTNIVEAIYYCTYLTSHRTNHDVELIKFDSDFAKIKLFSDDNYELVISKNQKLLKINDVKISRQKDFYASFYTVLFSPESIDILLRGPNYRRRFLDMLISSYDKIYLSHLSSYQHLLKQRNEYLKQMLINNLASKDYLEVIDQQISIDAQYIYEKRFDCVSFLNQKCHDIFLNFFDLDLVIGYDMQFDILNFDEYHQLMKLKLDRDMVLGQTQVGPHKDDLIFNVNNHNARYFCSKGQQRIVLIDRKSVV